MMIFLQFAAAGFLIGLAVAWFVVRRVYRAGKACGYLEGRNFLVKRRILLRTNVFLDALPLEDVGTVYIETNGFQADERERMARFNESMLSLHAPPGR